MHGCCRCLHGVQGILQQRCEWLHSTRFNVPAGRAGPVRSDRVKQSIWTLIVWALLLLYKFELVHVLAKRFQAIKYNQTKNCLVRNTTGVQPRSTLSPRPCRKQWRMIAWLCAMRRVTVCAPSYSSCAPSRAASSPLSQAWWPAAWTRTTLGFAQRPQLCGKRLMLKNRGNVR